MTAPRIKLLNRMLANQIAAGEVIERPASVVKELLENSIDAGATQIDVDIQEGGLRCIKVKDNGCGIHQADLNLAICCHATSKIATLADLIAIQSLGFRGEALASIAAVSRFWISSKPKEQEQAWQLHGAGIQDNIQSQPTAHPNGTTIIAQDLFFNTPARRKFIRSIKTEYLHIEEIFKRIALCYLNIGFSLTYENRLIFQCVPSTLDVQKKRRIGKFFGKNFLEHAVYIHYEATGLSLSGWVGTPDLTRSQNDLQYIYLNGRLMRDRVINHALRQAYADLLPEGRYALYLLYFNIDPELVDVNVHPTKHEVRFQQSRLIHDFLVHAVKQSLQKTPELPTSDISESSFHSTWSVAEPETTMTPPTPPPMTIHADNSWGKAITVLQQRWVLSENAHGILLIDNQQAWRTIWLHELQEMYSKKAFVSQSLLFPCTQTTTETMVIKLLAQQEILGTIGILIDQLSHNTIILRTLPQEWHLIESQKFLELLMGHLEKNLPVNIPAVLVFMARSYPCTELKAHTLLEKLHSLFPLQLPTLPAFCTHLSYADLALRFPLE